MMMVQRRPGRGLEPAWRALEPAGRALEPAGRALEPPGRPGASWEAEGGTEKKTDRQKEQSVTSMWWYHRSSSPTGPLPKREVFHRFLSAMGHFHLTVSSGNK